MSDIATITHMSDFHFVRNLGQQSSAFFLKPISAEPHSFPKIESLAIKFRNMNKRTNKTDITVFSGDLTTDGKQESYNTALKYLDQEMITDRKDPHLKTMGLKTNPLNRLLVPGNHDRFKRRIIGWQEKTSMYEEMLRRDIKSDQNPYVIGFRRGSSRSSDNSPAMIFFMLDSTKPEHIKWRFGWKFARGYLSEFSCDQIVTLAQQIKTEKKVVGIDGRPLNVIYDDCVRVAVLHHDPFHTDEKMGLEGAKSFIDACSNAKIDIVLYGHIHMPDFREYPPVENPQVRNKGHVTYFIRAASASGFDSKNGFNVYFINHKSFDKHEYLFDEHKRQFVLGSRNLKLPFTR